MSIDHFVYVDRAGKGHKDPNPIPEEWREWEERASIFEQCAGIEYLYIYEEPQQATANFAKWRCEPCEDIRLTLNGVLQPGGRVEWDEPEEGYDAPVRVEFEWEQVEDAADFIADFPEVEDAD